MNLKLSIQKSNLREPAQNTGLSNKSQNLLVTNELVKEINANFETINLKIQN